MKLKKKKKISFSHIGKKIKFADMVLCSHSLTIYYIVNHNSKKTRICRYRKEV